MADWRFYFELNGDDDSRILKLIDLLRNANLLIEPIKEEQHVWSDRESTTVTRNLTSGLDVSSYQGKDPSRDWVTFSFYVDNSKMEIHKNHFVLIKILSEVFDEIKVICEECGPGAVYEGSFSWEIFEKIIKPKIEGGKCD